MIEGSNSVVMINKDEPKKLYLAKNGSPLYVGVLDDGYIVGSETSTFSNHTQKFIDPEDNVVLALDISKEAPKFEEGKKLDYAQKEKIQEEPKPGFDTFMEQEIYEQPEAIMRTLNYGGRITFKNQVKLGGLDANHRRLKQIDNLIIAACGTSYYAGVFGAKLMRKMGVFNTVQLTIGSEASEEIFPAQNAGLLSITQSGETEDLKHAI